MVVSYNFNLFYFSICKFRIHNKFESSMQALELQIQLFVPDILFLSLFLGIVTYFPRLLISLVLKDVM